MKQIIPILLTFLAFGFSSCDTTKKAVSTTTDTGAEIAKEPKVPMNDAQGISFFAANERYSAEGTFKKWEFTKASMVKNDIETLNAEISIDLTSIWEKSDKLTEHLKANDYFDVAKFTKALVTISNVKKMQNKGLYSADMKLDMRGFTQKLVTKFKVVNKKPMTVSGTAMIDRSIFKIGVENTSVPDMIEVRYSTVIPN